MITLQRTTSDNTDFQYLVPFLDAELRIRDGDDHAFFAQFNKTDQIRHVVVAYIDNQAVGCGAFKVYNEKIAEIKRMFVLSDFRGKGIASHILTELEKWASEVHYTEAILETGKNQPEAIALYQKMGYHIIPKYGQYENAESSVCMKKMI